MTLKGTIEAEGDNYVFVSDKDAKSWDAMNPEELKRRGKENQMKKSMTICFGLSLLLCGLATAQDTMKQDNMKADGSAKATKVTGKISDDGKTFVSDKDSKSWTIQNPDAVKGREGHHVTMTAHVYADKGDIHVMGLKMAKDGGPPTGDDPPKRPPPPPPAPK